MATIAAVGNIFITCVSQIGATVGAHGFIAALPHIGNIILATGGWLLSGVAGIATLAAGSVGTVCGITSLFI